MIAVEPVHQFQAGQFAGALLLVFETGEHLVLDARERIGREGRFADHFREQLQRGFAFVRGAEAAQGCQCHVLECAVAKVRAQAFEALGDGADIFTGHAFVEHGVGQYGQARRVGVLAAAGGKDQAQVEHRQFASLDEQHLGAFGGVPGLHIQTAAAGCLAIELGQRLQFLAGLGLVQGFAGL